MQIRLAATFGTHAPECANPIPPLEGLQVEGRNRDSSDRSQIW
jgi:hypothetical protein